tara:strand:- start:90 stop:614 length:525 start_codon:yes stop_codon:yes gene_type:complete
MKTFKEFFQLGVTRPSKSDVQNYLNGLGTRLMQLPDIKKKIINHFKNIKNLKLDTFGRKVLSFEEFIKEGLKDLPPHLQKSLKDFAKRQKKLKKQFPQLKVKTLVYNPETGKPDIELKEVEEAKQGHALVVGGKIVARDSKSKLLKKIKKDGIKIDHKKNFLTLTGKEVGDSWD